MKKIIITITLLLTFAFSAYAQVEISKPITAKEAKYFALLSQSQTYFDGAKYDKALEYAESAYALMPTKELAMNIAFINVKLGNGHVVASMLNNEEIREPWVVSSLITKLIDERDFKGAIKVMDYAANLSDDGSLLFARAYYHETVHQTSQAKDYYNKALEIDPMLPEAHFNLARLFEAEEDYTQAIKFYDNATTYSKPGSELHQKSSARAFEIVNAMGNKLHDTIK